MVDEMSTILDALKKIESDKRRELPERGLFEQVAKEECPRPPSPVRPWRTWILVILLCAGASIATLVLTRSFTGHLPTPQSPASISTTGPEDLDEGVPRKEVADLRGPGHQADRMDAVKEDRDERPAEPSAPPVDADFVKESYSEPTMVTHSNLPAGLDLKINAIVWSKDPKARFAMVNHRSVRKGDEIHGATVVEITPDWIVFDYRGELFQVAIKE